MDSTRKRANLAHMYRIVGEEPADADLATNTQVPHLNAKDYQLRAHDASQNNEPQEFHESFDINSSGNIVVAINDYRRRFFVGHFWGYKSLQDFTKQKSPSTNRRPVTNTPVYVIRFVKDSLVALGRAEGTVELWSTNNEREDYFTVEQRNEHIGDVLDIGVFSQKKDHIVTVDAEGCIKIWEVNAVDSSCTQTFRNAHGDSIASVSTCPESDHIFATASRDKSVLMWDYRLTTKPASGLYTKHLHPFTALTWIGDGGESSIVKVGDHAGSILTIDTRKPNEILQVVSALKRPVKRIRATGGKYAVCGHTNVFKLFTTNDDVIFEDSSSEDFVRDLFFHNGKVMGLCWDGNIIERDL